MSIGPTPRAWALRLPWRARYRAGPKVFSELRKIGVELTHLHCRVEFQGPVRLGPGFSLDIPEAGAFVVGPGVDFRRGFVCEISGNGRVTIGGGSIFTSSALVQCTTSIDIGPRCVFGQALTLVDGSHRFGDPSRHLLDQGYDYRPLTVGPGAVVMSKCTVFADIGEGAVVGANSVVSRPVPPHCLALGAPARPVSFFGAPDPALVERGSVP